MTEMAELNNKKQLIDIKYNKINQQNKIKRRLEKKKYLNY